MRANTSAETINGQLCTNCFYVLKHKKEKLEMSTNKFHLINRKNIHPANFYIRWCKL